jgi:hypothetical protein
LFLTSSFIMVWSENRYCDIFSVAFFHLKNFYYVIVVLVAHCDIYESACNIYYLNSPPS